MSIHVIPKVISSRTVDARRLGWLSGKRAETRRNFPANFQYIDLRGLSADDVDQAIAEEAAQYRELEESGYSWQVVDKLDRQRAASPTLPVDFGVAAAVSALSALGCVPVTSCRGPTLGGRPHSHPAPMVVFYARKAHLPALLESVTEADCQIVNNVAKVEIYADDVRKLHRFAVALRSRLAVR